MVVTNLQLGKAGVSDNFIENVKNAFKRHDTVKVSILQSCCRDRDEIKMIGEDICKKLNDQRFSFKPKIIGFTITLLRFKKKKKVKR